MKKMGIIAVLSLVTASGWAQGSFDDEVNSELDTMYQQNHAVPVPAQVQAQNQPQPNVQVNVQSAVQKQPTTVIEASPLTESRVERIRKARQESELQTEQKIVEKLEISRMEDEKRRSDVLFGDKLNNMNSGAVQSPAPMNANAPAEVVVKSAALNMPEEKLDRDAVHEEMVAALAEQKNHEGPTRKTYISVLGGMGIYNNQNIRSNGAGGIGLGQKINDSLFAEVGFVYSDYNVTLPYSTVSNSYYGYPTYNPVVQEMKQYSGVGEVKYALFSGALRPVLGVAAAYSYRNYSTQYIGLSSFGSTSNAFDLGPLAGVDFDLMENFSIGFEGRYMWNIYNQVQSNNGYNNTSVVYTGNGVSPESLGYFMVGLTGRVSF